MKILFFDLDTVRADHLGCYGYGRATSPNIDEIAGSGVRFDNYYCPNAPCLPSRASLVSGQYGIINGVVGHGGTAADMRLEGAGRGFHSAFSRNNLFLQFRKAGYHTASVSTFAERHSAWWFYAGFNECYNVGKGGLESAEEVMPVVRKWLDDHGREDNWLLHVNLWDAHTPYRMPPERENVFADQPLSDDWIDEEVFRNHQNHIGPHSVREIAMWDDRVNPNYPRHPGKLENLAQVKNFIDLYDCGIRYMDECIGEILQILKAQGTASDDLAVIVTSDHGENMGELGIYGEHATADEPTCRIPMIIRWPGMQSGIVSRSFHTNVDLLPTVCDLLGTEKSPLYDGESYCETLKNGTETGADSVVLTQCAHVLQRSARFDRYLYIRTVYGGGHMFDEEMLFDVENDPHEQVNLAPERPDLVDKGARIVYNWQNKYMEKSPYQVDPMWTVLKEGGPEHAPRAQLEKYAERLEATGRDRKAYEERYHLNGK